MTPPDYLERDEDGQVVITDIEKYGVAMAQARGHTFAREMPRDYDRCLRCGCSYAAGDMMLKCRGNDDAKPERVGARRSEMDQDKQDQATREIDRLRAKIAELEASTASVASEEKDKRIAQLTEALEDARRDIRVLEHVSTQRMFEKYVPAAREGFERTQLERLAQFIVAEIPGEPSQSEGAGDCAIRVVRELQARVAELERCNEAMRGPIMRLRDMIGMPAQGEGIVIDHAIRLLKGLLSAKESIVEQTDSLEQQVIELKAQLADSAARWVALPREIREGTVTTQAGQTGVVRGPDPDTDR